ncbi:cation channel sperm-associated auxiliary subunit gamma-like [Mobula hypostoma]|uniref:cation channel sperm-associated auxiliary subunit gamma-like n=1 Tax=Mobula hypostoma TaxID=723540 RepID=UPI002FC3B816
MCLAYYCEWHTDLSKFSNRKEFSEAILQQHPAANLDLIFQNLTDQGIDSDDVHYYAFPYFIKITLSCQNQKENEIAARSAYLQGMCPIVNIKFQPPVNSIYNLPELLEMSLTAAAIANDVQRSKAGAVVSFKVGKGGVELFDSGVLEIDNLIPIPHKSQPLFYLTDNNPVLILGEVPNRKIVLLSTNEFDSFSILELNIDSCWIASLSCPRGQFSASIFDVIATESMLFIRQNQLMYYFKGNFTLLRANDKGSDRWKRVLSNVCVEKLIPVLVIQKGEEKLFAIGGGKQKAMTYLGTIKDGEVYFKSLLNSQGNTVCSVLRRDCLVLWAAFDRYKNAAVLLVEGIVTDYQPASYFLIYYYFETANFMMHYELPLYIPKEKQDFVLLVGTEEYSNTPLKPVGITLSHVNSMAYLWGNFLFSSYNLGTTWLAVPKVPPHTFIKFFIHSWNGDFIFMTDNEELWCGRDGYSVLTCIRPSKNWNTFVTMQNIRGINVHYKNETTLTVFYDRQKSLKEIVYATLENGTTIIFKRAIPVDEILSYAEPFPLPSYNDINDTNSHLTFLDNCPFGIIKFQPRESSQFFNRIQIYTARPPWIFSSTGLHNDLSLTVYQGLLYGLLSLHSTYYSPYVDPVHDPTWRWWKNSWQTQNYHVYLANNKLTKGGFYVEAYDYRKTFKKLMFEILPSVIYMDKNSMYNFDIYLTVNTGQASEKYEINQAWLFAQVSSPKYVLAELKREELMSSGNLIYKVSLKDQNFYQGQSLSGEDLVLVSVLIKVVNSDFACFSEFGSEVTMEGSIQLTVYVGCPPGNRLVFDVAYTLKYIVNKSKVHFDCLEHDEIPCFYYEQPFYPFFLIQDLVIGKSNRFLGSYTFKVIGGGPYRRSNIRKFSPQEILLYNSVNYRNSYTAIWKTIASNPNDEQYTNQGIPILQSDTFGIRWVCQKNSPCSDIPAEGLKGPEYFFLIEVSNRGIDTSTYCDYKLEFIIHVHGLPLNPHRALLFMLITLSILWSVLLSFIIYRCYHSWFKNKIKTLSLDESMILPDRTDFEFSLDLR